MPTSVIDPLSGQTIGCHSCRWRDGPGEWTCRAYPEGIPGMIRNGIHDHRRPYKGDNGIRWESIALADEPEEPPT